MNVTVENVAACRKKLNIEVPVDEITREWKGVLSEFQKYAQLPGFRVGRAPAAMLEKRFEQEISSEVQRKLIPQSFREAVAKEKLKVVSMPSIEEVKFSRSEPLRFQATVDVAPEFKLPKYKGLKVKKPKVEVKQDEVDNALKMLAEQQATFADVTDRALKLGDFAVISYTGTSDGKTLTEFSPAARPLAENKQFWLLMGKDSFLPGFCEPLVGAKIGDARTIQVEVPKEFRVKELSGLKVDYAVTVLGIKEKKLPELDDAFAATYRAANLEELKTKVRENLQHDREQETDHSVRQQIIEQLLKETSFELPESIVNAETRSTMVDIVRENQMRGIAEDSIREKSKDILDAAAKNAQDKVRSSFILARIAAEEKLEVKDDELQKRIEEAAQRAGKSVRDFTRQLQSNEDVESLREQILLGRALDLLVTHASVETES